MALDTFCSLPNGSSGQKGVMGTTFERTPSYLQKSILLQKIFMGMYD